MNILRAFGGFLGGKQSGEVDKGIVYLNADYPLAPTDEEVEFVGVDYVPRSTVFTAAVLIFGFSQSDILETGFGKDILKVLFFNSC